jgi:hypothetical protein
MMTERHRMTHVPRKILCAGNGKIYNENIKLLKSSCKLPVIYISDFEQIWNTWPEFLTKSNKKTHKNPLSGIRLIQADRGTERHKTSSIKKIDATPYLLAIRF